MHNVNLIYRVNEQGMIVEEIDETDYDSVIPYDAGENWVPDGYIQPEQGMVE